MLEIQPRSAAVDRAAKLAAFCHFFGVGRAPGMVLTALYEADGSHRTAEDLALFMASTPGAAQRWLSTLRSALEVEAIDSDRAGYRLTDIGLAECADAMRQMRESLAA